MDSLGVGSFLGEYEILDHIGRGGMGVVYAARQTSLDRVVAIKVLPAELCADEEYVERFLREARAAAILNHPHIIQIFDAGVLDGIYFFVMEFVDGKNLSQIIKSDGRMEERDALYAIHQAAEGLTFAHSLGIVHRDVKPENIMVTGTGIIKIGDLGLAKWKPNERDISLTASGATMGTPYYISPEQIRGWTDIDGRADIYSLGMTLYHILTGNPAFSTGTGPEIMAQHLSEEPPPLHLLNPNISQKTMDLFDAMTVKKRENRIQEMTVVVDSIGEILGLSHDATPKRSMRAASTSENQNDFEDLLSRILQTGVQGVMVALAISLLVFFYLLWDKSKFKPSKAIQQTKPDKGVSWNLPLEQPAKPPPVPVAVQPETPKPPPPEPMALTSPKTDQVRPVKISDPAPSLPNNPQESREAVSKPSVSDSSSYPEPVKAPEPKIIQGVDVFRITPIYEGYDFTRNAQDPFKFTVGRILYPNGSLKAASRVLLRIRFELFPNISIAQKIRDCKSAVLELTPVSVSSADRNRDFEIEIYRLLKPWGEILLRDPYEKSERTPSQPESRWNQYMEQVTKETNWEQASSKERWSISGADKDGSDYYIKGLIPVGAPQSQKTINLSAFPTVPSEPLRIEVLPDLQEWSNKMSNMGKFIPHYGWIIKAAKGSTGGVIFHSHRTEFNLNWNERGQGPRLILVPKTVP